MKNTKTLKKSARDTGRLIMHIDMDAFYASVEQADNPQLKGKPVIVGGGTRGVVSAASYEARKFGVKSAMPMFKAKKLCPHAIFLPVRIPRYKEISDLIMSILREFSPLVEKISIDEAFLDITGTEILYGSPKELAKRIKKQIKSVTGLTCSVGIAPNKLLAKIASDMNKPDGLTVIEKKEVRRFMDKLPVEKLPGIGKQTSKDLKDLGIKTASDVLRFEVSFWEKRYGKSGIKLFEKAQGHDASPVTPTRQPKSFGAENTFPTDTSDHEDLKKWILFQSEKVGRHLRTHGYMAKRITVKIKYCDFKTKTHSRSLHGYTNSTKIIFDTAVELLKEINPKKKVRLTGVTASKLQKGVKQMKLIEDISGARQEKIDEAIDHITKKFGEGALKRGLLLDWK